MYLLRPAGSAGGDLNVYRDLSPVLALHRGQGLLNKHETLRFDIVLFRLSCLLP